MGSDDAPFAEGIVEELEVGLLEEALSGAIGIGGVGDDDIEGVLVLVEELEAISDVNSALGVGETLSHAGKVLLGQTNDGLQSKAIGQQSDTSMCSFG